MALFGNVGDDYTKTGKGFFTKLANGLSYIPDIPFLTSWIKGGTQFALGMVDTVLEAGQWLFNGKIGSAATALVAGTVGNGVNALASGTFWWFNAGSGIASGETLGTHARALTENIIGGVTGALGSKPQVLSSYPAGIGSISNGVVANGPGKFAAGVSTQRGQNADEAYKRYMSGEGGVHVNELQSAYGRGA
jgi:hypothetical protein